MRKKKFDKWCDAMAAHGLMISRRKSLWGGVVVEKIYTDPADVARDFGNEPKEMR